MKYKIIVDTSKNNRPKDHEMLVAILLAEYFKRDVIFLRPGVLGTPDLNIDGVLWEIKSPLGNSKKTIENNLRSARKQSSNIVIDLSRTSMNYYKAVSGIKAYLNTNNHDIKQLKVVTKSKKIIDILQRNK